MSTTVYGYIRLEDDDRDDENRLHDQLTAHAAAEGLALADVFVDRHMPPGRIVRPGLTELLARLRRTEGPAVLVTDLDHLSPSAPIRQAIESEISNAGGRVLASETPDGRPSEPLA